MDEDTVALQRLEQMMNEFFSSGATNERIRSIEQSLHEFTSQINSWKPCLHFLSSTRNHYVSMFSLSALETTISKRWPILWWEDQALIRSTLYTLSLEQNIPPFVRNKVVKLVVDIAKHDWPQFYPDFFSNILQLLNHKQTRQLGLIYLRTASEELGTPREDVTIRRKIELNKLLNSQISITLDALTGLLCDTIKLNDRSGTVTPPPSPTIYQTNSNNGIINNNNNNNNDNNNEICISILEVLGHLFSWIIPTTNINNNLLDGIFTCAKYDDTMNEKKIEMAIQAMTTINELLYRPCSKNIDDNYLLYIFNNGIKLFQLMEKIDIIDERYIDKTTEYLQLFIKNQFKKIENNNKFNLRLFFELLYYHTFNNCKTISSYLNCLEIWNILFENNDKNYTTISIEYIKKLIEKILFKNNNLLNLLDTEIMDDNNETEWQNYIRLNIESIAIVANNEPIIIFNILYQSWLYDLKILIDIGNALTTNQGTLILNNNDGNNVHSHLRDFATITQALGRIYINFTNDYQSINNETIINNIDELIIKTIDICEYLRDNNIYHTTIQPTIIIGDLIEINSQLLASLKAWCHYIINKNNENDKITFYQRTIDICLSSLVPTRADNIPDNIVHSSAHLLQTITSVLRPNLWNCDSFKGLICMSNYPYLNNDTEKILRRCLINCIVLTNGDDEIRFKLMEIMINKIVEPIGIIGQQIPNDIIIQTTINPLIQIINDCSSSSTNIKRLLHQCFLTTINRILEILPQFIHNNTSEILMNFLHSIFLVLQQQLGSEFIKNSVQKMLHIYTSENINSGPALDQFLEILILVISSPSNSFKTFLPSIINLCLVHVWPNVSVDSNLHHDTILVLLKLFYNIFSHRWQYFNDTTVLMIQQQQQQQQDNNNDDEQMKNNHELIAILEIFGQALLQTDVNIFQKSLKSLEDINKKWRLYRKNFFKNHLLERFIMALFTVLQQRSHNLLADEIADAIHNLSFDNFTWFFTYFLPKFLAGTEGLDDVQRNTLLENFDKSTDQPTFTRSVLRFFSDLRCYQICSPVERN